MYMRNVAEKRDVNGALLTHAFASHLLFLNVLPPQKILMVL